MKVEPDDWESHWDRHTGFVDSNPAQNLRHKVVLQQIQRQLPSRILDVGCGKGDLLGLLAQHFDPSKLAGLELSSTGAKATSARIPQAQILQQDLTKADYVPFSSDFDCLTCLEVLEHVDDPLVLLSAAVKHLVKGGRAIVTVPSGPRTAFDISIGHRAHFSMKDVHELMNQAGLRDVQVRRIGFPFFNLYRLLIFLRGKRLIRDIESERLHDSRLARISTSTFNVLFRLRADFIPLGWQIIAVGIKP